jgi:hypothetical protein
MDEALAAWLALREPVDERSRSGTLTRAVADSLANEDPVRVLDLATGAGSNLRFLMQRLRGNQHWTVVDRSAALLGELPKRTESWAKARGYDVTKSAARFAVTAPGQRCQVESRERNLHALDDAGLFEGRHLVTASALLDLVSESWLQTLAARCREAGAAALFTITYNGHSSCSPLDRDDERVLDLFNRHQRTDKGLGGVAAGADATACAIRAFEGAGYLVRTGPSDWQLGPGERDLQRQLIDGWAGAAMEIAAAEASRIAEWRVRRMEHLDVGRSHIVVGHHDLAAWPTQF